MNPHGLNDHRHLKPARLPIPPLLHILCASCSSAHVLIYNIHFELSTTFLFFVFIFLFPILLLYDILGSNYSLYLGGLWKNIEKSLFYH